MAILRILHLSAILLLLDPAPNKEWFNICLHLGVHPNTLRSIEANNNNNVEACLRNCLSYWLEKSNVNENTDPSCAQLVDALKKTGLRAKAEHINLNCDKEIEIINSKSRNKILDQEYNTDLPNYIKERFLSLNEEFGDTLQDIVEEAIKKKGLPDIKKHLSSICPGVSEDIKDIIDDYQLIGYYRNYSHLLNFDLLYRLVNSKKFGLSDRKKDLDRLANEVRQFSEETKVSDFMKHISPTIVVPHGQDKMTISVCWGMQSTLLIELKDFLDKIFSEKYRIHITLRSVHCSLLTLVCTIPHWIADELTIFLKNKELSLHLQGVINIFINDDVIITGPKRQCPSFGYLIQQYVKYQPVYATPKSSVIMGKADPNTPTKMYEYLKHKFNKILLEILKEVINKIMSLEDIKYFLAVEATVNLFEQFYEVKNKAELIAYFQNNVHLSNFGILMLLTDLVHREFGLFKFKLKLFELEDSRDMFYEEMKALDFAKLAIKDHETSSNKRQMTFTVAGNSKETTIIQFQEFLDYVFRKYRLHISLQSVNSAPLTFVCTIPYWIVDSLKSFVWKKENIIFSTGIFQVTIDGNIILPLPPPSSSIDRLMDILLVVIYSFLFIILIIAFFFLR